jgi:malate dehydrogenase (oxaloacetate-decarboxylating)
MLDVRASTVTDQMKHAAAQSLASVISDEELHPDYIIPSVFDRRVSQAVAEGVSKAAIDAGVARRQQKSGWGD